MTLYRSRMSDCVVLSNLGKESIQIVWPENVPDSNVTITRVIMQPGAVSVRHAHLRAEQIWIIEDGEALLLLDGGKREIIQQGDIIRTPAGEVHGIENFGVSKFIYLAVTSPAENMEKFYSSRIE